MMTQQIGIVIVIFITFVAMIVTGKVRIHVAAMFIPIALELTGILKFKDAWAGITDSSVITMASMFVVGAAISKTSLLSRMSRSLIKPRASDLKIMIGLTIPILFLGCFISPIAVMTIMIPMISAVCAEQKRPVSKFMYPCALIAQYWAGWLPTGGNAGGYLANNTIVETLGGVGTWTYFTTMISKAPMVILGIIVAIFVSVKMAPDKDNIPALKNAIAQNEAAKAKVAQKAVLSSKKEKFAIAVFILTVTGIVICALTKRSVWWPSTAAAFILVFSGVLTDREAISALGTPTIFIVAGTLPLATALKQTGADVLIADSFSRITGGASPIIIMIAMWLITSIMTQFMSNATVANIFKTMAALIAVQGGYDARAMMICSTQGGAAAFLAPTSAPVMTAANDAGGYSLKDFIKMGLPHYILNFLLFVLYVPLVFPLK